MNPRHRDGLLATAGVAGLVAVALATVGPAAVLDWRAVAVGVPGAVLVELLFLRYPERALDLWDRRGVPVAALVVLVAGAVVAVQSAAWLLGAAVWGLVVYLGLLGLVLAGVGNPLAPLAGPGE